MLAEDDPKETMVVVNVLRGMRDQFREPDEELQKNLASFISKLQEEFGADKDWSPRRWSCAPPPLPLPSPSSSAPPTRLSFDHLGPQQCVTLRRHCTVCDNVNF